jgi:hypothetical protein
MSKPAKKLRETWAERLQAIKPGGCIIKLTRGQAVTCHQVANRHGLKITSFKAFDGTFTVERLTNDCE